MPFKEGYSLQPFPIPPQTQEWIDKEDWASIYSAFEPLTAAGGAIFELLKSFCDFSSIELMLSIRDSQNDWEEDGIWHDDGSRVFAFSLSLTPDASTVKGGEVELRKVGSETSQMIPTPSFGTAICFLTGVWGYEHRTRRVTAGKRIILVGWLA